jgi:hypothetical protein
MKPRKNPRSWCKISIRAHTITATKDAARYREENMNIDPHQDPQIDQVLQALRRSIPPEGMEARIASHIAQQTTSPAPTRSRIGSLVPSASWWRGAITGAAFAMLAMGAVLSIIHITSPVERSRQAIPTNPLATAATPRASTVNYSAASGPPCLHPALLRKASVSPPPISTQLVAQTPPSESTAPSRPAPVLPLTAQERALIELARTADPKQLAVLNSETQAKKEAEDAAEFNKFFATPPRPPQPTDGEPSMNSNDNKSLL